VVGQFQQNQPTSTLRCTAIPIEPLKEQGERDRKTEHQRKLWQEQIRAVYHQFDWVFSFETHHRLTYWNDLELAIEAVIDKGPSKGEVALFRGPQWVASIGFVGSSHKVFRRDETEGGAK
jgi:hypothetical protein